MSGTYIWSNLAKAVNDATTIDEALATAVQAHDDDPNAHLEAGQALTTHRAAEIIDHLAESVVNDKIHSTARAYTAIVGSGTDGDYDTIQSALAYVVALGGGTIYLVPGEYYLSGIVELPISVNLLGSDAESTIIHGDYTGGDYFKFVDDIINAQMTNRITGIKFINDAGGVFHTVADDLSYVPTTVFESCIFDGGGQYMYTEYSFLKYTDCQFYVSNATAIHGYSTIKMDDCMMSRYGTATNCYLLGIDSDGVDYPTFYAQNTTLDCTGATTMELLHDGVGVNVKLLMSRIVGMAVNTQPAFFVNCVASYIGTKAGVDLDLNSDGQDVQLIGCLLWPWSPGIVLTSQNVFGLTTCLVVGGTTGIADYIGTTGELHNPGFNVAMSSYTNMELDAFNVVQSSPNSSRTLTTDVPRAGSRRTLIVLTSGTSSYVLTFGTGFKTTGTLTTGTTSVRRFIVDFISDGTYLIETGRTVAIT